MSKSRGLISSVQDVRYHRNGSAGAGFFTVSFWMRKGRARRLMVGIVFTKPTYDGPMTDGLDIHGYVRLRDGSLIHDVDYAVIDPADPSQNFRGDDFFPQLAEAVDEWSQNGKAYGARTYVGNEHRASGVLPADVINSATGEVTR